MLQNYYEIIFYKRKQKEKEISQDQQNYKVDKVC